MERAWFPIAFWVGALGIATALWMTLDGFYRLPGAADALRLDSAERLVATAPDPARLPVDGWQPVKLPDDWLHRGLQGTEVWYRARIDLNVPPNRLWAVLVPGINLAGAVFFNGELVGSSVRLEEPLPQDWNRPLMFSIPNGLIRSGGNVLHVRVLSYPSGHGFLAPVFLGPSELLLPSFESRQFLQVHLSRFITIATAFMSLFLGLIWWLKRSETVYGWLALTTLMWSAHSLKYHLSDIPVTSLQWAALLFVTAIGFCTAVIIFLHRFTGVSLPKMQRFVLGHAAVAVLVLTSLTLLETDLLYSAAQIFVSVALVLAGYNFVRMVVRIWNGRVLETYLVGAASLVVMVVGVRDWVLILGFMDRPSGQFTQYAIPLLLGVLGIVLVMRFVGALRASEQLTQTLENRVAAKTQELEANYTRLQELEREQTLAAERERLMRDMHDGVGGQLVSSLALLKAKGIEDTDLDATLSGALTDLRLMIDSLDPVDDDLNGVLGMLRDRMQRPMEAAGLKTLWQFERLPKFPDLGPDRVLQILRILQEALTNVLKHAHASQVVVGAVYDPERHRARLVVADDGRGMNGQHRGRGLRNMRTRAERLGAHLDLQSSDMGTRVTLELPYPSDGPGGVPVAGSGTAPA
ncbi:MAG: hypothetical protein R3E86_13585 [Pseudomonadales bacterium]